MNISETLSFFRNVEDFYFLKIDTSFYVIVAATYVLCSLCYEGFLTIHIGVVFIVTPGWNGEVNVEQV